MWPHVGSLRYIQVVILCVGAVKKKNDRSSDPYVVGLSQDCKSLEND